LLDAVSELAPLERMGLTLDVSGTAVAGGVVAFKPEKSIEAVYARRPSVARESAHPHFPITHRTWCATRFWNQNLVPFLASRQSRSFISFCLRMVIRNGSSEVVATGECGFEADRDMDATLLMLTV